VTGAKPRLSIGLPVYNGDRYLEQTLTSILLQDFGDFELILSDNASTDRTAEICIDVAGRDTRVQYHRAETNRGAAWNYNHVFHLARGEFFRWAPHDDYYAPDALGLCVRYLENASPGVILAYPATVLVSAAGEILEHFDDRLILDQPTPHERIRHLARWLNLCNPVLGVTRRNALARTRLIGSFAGSDKVLLAELALLGEFHAVPEATFYRRRHAGSSRHANTSIEAVARWFDTSDRVRTWKYPQLRLMKEHLISISRAPIGRVERVRSALAYVTTHVYKRFRVRLGLLKRRVLRGRPWPWVTMRR